MKTKGSNTYFGVPLKDLNRIFGEDAVIPCSKKAINAYLMAAGLDETFEIVTLSSKTISLKVTDNTEKKVEEKEKETVYVPMPTPEEQEMAPPLDINISDGDW
tara:strand:- start:88 stop:396 length:309 start_codon:yes stop_codon:yes gene_type:complete